MVPFHISSGEEAKIYLRIRHYRDRFFEPVCAILAKKRCSPDLLSYLGIFCALLFALFFAFNIWVAFLFLLLNQVFDSLDGSLARFTNKTSTLGSLTDTTADHLSFLIVFMTLLYFRFLDAFWGAFYLTNYVVMIFLLVILNFKQVKFFPVIKSKYIIYLLFLIMLIGGANFFDPVLVFFSIYMLIVNSFLFHKLRCSI